jgi:hypothetical protein|tara:strand:+ start:1854 stop:1955 length:102 start_codon:yes stop_codon:yes gene_type:complete
MRIPLSYEHILFAKSMPNKSFDESFAAIPERMK